MIPIINFPVQIDKKTWETFKARVRKEGLTSAKAAVLKLIEYFINHGLPPEPPKKDKP